MNRPEPIELENNLGPDAVTGEINRVPWMAYDVDEMDIYIAEKDAEIARLKDELDAANNQCENLINSATDIMLRQDKVNDTKFAEIESLKASHYAEMVDAGMRERRLRRALWLARANNARNSYLKWNLYANFESEDNLFTIDEFDESPGVTDFSTLRTYEEWYKVWQNVERKCQTKAEESR